MMTDDKIIPFRPKLVKRKPLDKEPVLFKVTAEDNSVLLELKTPSMRFEPKECAALGFLLLLAAKQSIGKE